MGGTLLLVSVEYLVPPIKRRRTMKRMLLVFSTGLGLCLASASVRADKSNSCKWSDVNRLKDHVSKHVTYPVKGKDLKEACKKEWPDEFSKAERACAEAKLKDDTEYKSAAEVLKTLGAQ
jgi:hypothetical protein